MSIYGGTMSSQQAKAREIKEACETAECAPTPRIVSEMDRLRMGMDRCHEQVTRLEERLGGVLQPDYPRANSSGDALERVPSSPLAEGLAGLNEQLAMVKDRISNLLDRLEL